MHEFVLVMENMGYTPQIFEKSLRVYNYYRIYVFKVLVHCIGFVN